MVVETEEEDVVDVAEVVVAVADEDVAVTTSHNGSQ